MKAAANRPNERCGGVLGKQREIFLFLFLFFCDGGAALRRGEEKNRVLILRGKFCCGFSFFGVLEEFRNLALIPK